MLPYYHAAFVANNNEQQWPQQAQQPPRTQQNEGSYDIYEQSMMTEHAQGNKEINHVNFSPMPDSSQDTMNSHQQHRQQQAAYPEYVLMHDQPYPEFTYDSNTLMTNSALTPLPETGYVRQQEDVFNELILLANRRQHHPPLVPPAAQPQAPPHLSSSSYSYPTHLSHEAYPYTTTAADIMTAGPSSLSSSASAPLAAPPPASLAGAPWDALSQERIYELKVVQQPYRARMCGFGDKDRRPISPPPILQMVTRTKDGCLVKPETIDISFFIALCDSWHEDGITEANLVYHSFSSPTQPHEGSSSSTPHHHRSIDYTSSDEITKTLQMRNLVGSSVASATKLYDLDGNLGIFFVFQDISFRTEGKFKLGFSLINIGSCGNTVNTSSSSQVLTRVFTDMFTVFTAKKFPGVVKSTPLSQCFAKQGVKIPIRKDTQVTRKKSATMHATSSSLGLHDDDDEADDGDVQ